MKKLLLALLLLTSPAYAQDAWVSQDFTDLSGGLNDGTDAISIAINEASDLQNMVFTTGKTIEQRGGFTPINSSALSATADVTGVFMYKQADQTRFLIGVASDTTDAIYKMDYTGSGPDGTWDDITGATVLSFTVDDQADFTVGQDTLIIEDGNGGSAPYTWDGTGNIAALGGSPPDASMVEYHKNHLFLAGDETNPSRLTFSELCTNATAPSCIETFTATDIVDVETNDGQIIRSIKSALDCLYIFKDRSIWRLCGNERDTFTLEQMVSGIGTLSNQSVVLINNQFVFTTGDCDIATYNGGLDVKIISSKVEGTLEGLNYDRCDDAVAVAFDDGTGDEDYYVSMSGPGSGTHNLVMLYDTFHQAWSKFSGINANVISTYELGTLQRAIIFGDYTGDTHRYPTGTNDDGTAITSYYQSGHIRFPEYPKQKLFHQIQTILDQEGDYDVNFRYRIDFSNDTSTSIDLSTPGAVWDSAIYDVSIYADSSTTVDKIDVGIVGDYFQFRIENDDLDEPFNMKAVRVWFEPKFSVGEI